MPAIPKTDIKAEREGVWITHYGIGFLVGRRDTPAYTKRQEELLDPHRAASLRGNLQPAVLEEIAAKLDSEFVILDWKDMEDDKGESMPHSKEKCFEMLMDPQFRPWREWVFKVGNSDDIFLKQSVEAAKGN